MTQFIAPFYSLSHHVSPPHCLDFFPRIIVSPLGLEVSQTRSNALRVVALHPQNPWRIPPNFPLSSLVLAWPEPASITYLSSQNKLQRLYPQGVRSTLKTTRISSSRRSILTTTIPLSAPFLFQLSN